MSDVLEELRTGFAARVHYCGLATFTLNEVVNEIRDYQVTHPGLVDKTHHCKTAGCKSVTRWGGDGWVTGRGRWNVQWWLCPTHAKEAT